MLLIAIQRDFAVGDRVYGPEATVVLHELFVGALYFDKDSDIYQITLRFLIDCFVAWVTCAPYVTHSLLPRFCLVNLDLLTLLYLAIPI